MLHQTITNMTDLNTIWIVDLEAVESRYTGEWKHHFPDLMRIHGFGTHEVEVIEGPRNIPEATTPGAFLNFGGTNIYKSAQMEKISRLFCDGKIKSGDHFIYTDAWNPTIIQLKYMSELLQIPIKIHGLWHAGNYDPNDFLGRLISDKWVKTFETSLAQTIDYNWFASDDHLKMFRDNFGYDDIECFRTGWPMEYLSVMFKPKEKENIILFPHRIAPEKQVEIFKDLAKSLPKGYKCIVCQEENLSKSEYHSLLERSKLVFSANLQETLGISCYEGALAGAIPMVPNRLSYKEMYSDDFKYPSKWTESWELYTENKDKLISTIIEYVEHHDHYKKQLKKLTTKLHEEYFSCNGLKKVLFNGK